MKTDYEPFDVAADYLVSEERIAGYLSAAAEDEDPNVLLLALCDAAKARGMMEVAKAAGLNRESLYKALKPGAHPRFETVQAVLRALGVKLAVSARTGEAREALDTQADEARLTQLVEEVVEADKSYIEQAKETSAARKASETRVMKLPRVESKIMERSYQRSGVVAGGVLLSSGAHRPPGEGIVKAGVPDSIAADSEKKRGRRTAERRGNPREK